LHLGNLRTALLAWRHCRALGGTFILRVEDIDLPRTVAGAEARMLDDLRWLGLDWDEGPDVGGPAGPYRQSERSEFYAAALRCLEGLGRTYPCTCSRRDLREASAPHGEPTPELLAGESPVYPGTCRGRNADAQWAHPAGAAVRFSVEEDPLVEFFEEGHGLRRFELPRLCGDFIVRRRDGLFAYQLACAVDDGLMGVTHVVRGADLLTSAPRQIALLRALGLAVPQYCHTALVADGAGLRMCKRDASYSLGALRAQGVAPDAAREMIMNAPLVAE
jgi:glutamyl-tRNA synthetase